MDILTAETIITIEDFQVERVHIEAGVEVVIEEVAGCVDVRARVSGHLHLRDVGERAILHALPEQQELTEHFHRVPRRHVRGVSVADIDDASSVVDLSANRDEVVDVVGERAVGGFSVRDRGVGSSGDSRDLLRCCAEYEEGEEQGSHGRQLAEDTRSGFSTACVCGWE